MASTTNEIIYKVKNLCYAAGISDDTDLDDDLILGYLNTERSNLLKQEFERNRLLNQVLIQSLGCLEIECADKIECCNLGIDSGELIYRTVREIPTPLFRNRAGLSSSALITYVGEVTLDKPFEFTSKPISYRDSWRRFTRRDPVSFYTSDRIYIRNLEFYEEPPMYITIEGIFENPDEVSDFYTCEEDACFDRDQDYPLTAHLESPLLSIMIKKYIPLLINRPLQDTDNNASEF